MPESHEHPNDLLPELALGVLSDAEATTLHAHLAGCEACSTEYQEMERVTRLLPLAAQDLEPSPRLKDAVFERIRNEAVTQKPAAVAEARVSRPRPWQWYGAAAAAAAVLAIAAGFTGFALRDGGSGNGGAARQAQVVESAARGDLKVSRATAGVTKVSVVRAPGATQVFALVEGLPAHGDGKAYQAWFSKDGRTYEPSDTFDMASGGVWLPAGASLDGYVSMAFTIEDAKGAKQPTQAPFVVVDFTKSTALRP